MLYFMLLKSAYCTQYLQVVPVISELVGALCDPIHQFHSRPIVVLAKRDKEDMSTEIIKQNGGTSSVEIHTRSGR